MTSGHQFWERFDKTNPDLTSETMPLVKEILPKEKILLYLSGDPVLEEGFYQLVASYLRDAIDYGKNGESK